MAASNAVPRLQLRIDLLNVKPPIWRRLVVDGAISVAQLHTLIQRAMGWEDCHLHEFVFGEQRIGPPSGEASFGMEDDVVPESTVRLADAIGQKRKFRYWYDFGDDWWHEIAIEKRLPADPDAPPAELVDGRRACPPEDCGGPWGYANLLAILSDASHPEHGETLDWIGPYDPEHFDLAVHARAVAAALRRRRPRAAKKKVEGE